MRCAVIVGGIPNPTTGGGALTAWSVIKSLTSAGHSVTACLIENLHSSPSSKQRQALLDPLTQLGVKVVSIEHRDTAPAAGTFLDKSFRLLRAAPEDYYPTVILTPKLRSVLHPESPQAIFVYHFEALAAAHTLNTAPILAGVGDPTHLPAYYSWKQTPARLTKEYAVRTVTTAIAMARLPVHMQRMMSSCEVSGAFAAHHAAWFRKIGVPNCQYFRTPVVDDAGPCWKERRLGYRRKPKFKILLVGHLKGTATLSGLRLFAGEVLPRLERQLGTDAFEIHIVGGYSLPDSLAKLFDRPCVKMRGQIEPATEEFLSSDVVVVPTPIKLGIRVRILTAFSFGCCVVAHQANALGIPEMVHRKNALLAKDGKSMTEEILTALADPDLIEKVGEEARKTYKECFSLATAGRRIVAEMERLARA